MKSNLFITILVFLNIFILGCNNRNREICKNENYKEVLKSDRSKYNIDDNESVRFSKKVLFKTNKLQLTYIIKMATHTKFKRLFLEFEGSEVQDISMMQSSEVLNILVSRKIDNKNSNEIIRIFNAVKECETIHLNRSVF